MGVKGFDLEQNLKVHVEVNRWPRKKSIKKLNAEDYTSDLLAEAESIFNNADEVLASFADEEYLLAA